MSVAHGCPLPLPGAAHIYHMPMLLVIFTLRLLSALGLDNDIESGTACFMAAA